MTAMMTNNKKDLHLYSYHTTAEQALEIYKATGELPVGYILSIGFGKNGEKIYNIIPSRSNKENK